jgi:hypothetical protein
MSCPTTPWQACQRVFCVWAQAMSRSANDAKAAVRFHLLSYAVSYLFIAIVWTNHHYLMRCASAPPKPTS